ncbi:RNA polymerase sigma factor [Nonlabens antarcticus]|uniref:RNA polymerase sigma factor n=1 Tax=Nonlabens antarcticus TaxID=392714 RepID=UPI001891CE72|nr:RNA polymerase sigma factor [Nonlabens antarcticus]
MNEKEFTGLYNQLYPKVYRLCLGYVTGDEPTARDLSQQTFIKVWNHRHSFKGDSQISTWIYRIAVNCCLGHLKKKHPIKFEIDPKTTDAPNDDEPRNSKNIQQLYRCIDQLKPLNKIVILLELEQIPQEEIASTLGYSHGSIRTRLSRIREALFKCMTHGK